MRVLRGGSGYSQSEVVLHNQTVVVTYGDPEARGTNRSVYVLRHLAGSTMSECFLLINTIFFIILNMIKF
jgi:hypothetical protein